MFAGMRMRPVLRAIHRPSDYWSYVLARSYQVIGRELRSVSRVTQCSSTIRSYMPDNLM